MPVSRWWRVRPRLLVGRSRGITTVRQLPARPVCRGVCNRRRYLTMADSHHVTRLNYPSDPTHRHPGPNGPDSHDAPPATGTSDCSRPSGAGRDSHDISDLPTDMALRRASTSTLCVAPSSHTSDTSQPSIAPQAGKQRGHDTGLPVNRCFAGFDSTATGRPSGRGDHSGGPSHHHDHRRLSAGVVGGVA